MKRRLNLGWVFCRVFRWVYQKKPALYLPGFLNPDLNTLCANSVEQYRTKKTMNLSGYSLVLYVSLKIHNQRRSQTSADQDGIQHVYHMHE